MKARSHRWRFWLGGLWLAVALPAQDLGPFAARVHQRVVAWGTSPPPLGSQAPVVDALVAELQQQIPTLSRTDLGAVTTDLYYAAGYAGYGQDWQHRRLEQAEAVFRADPQDVDGIAPILVLRGRDALATGRLARLEADWCQLWRRAPAPKRFWLAAEAGRNLINLCRQPGLAEQEISAALAELLQVPAWAEPSRRAIAGDPDLYLTMRDRSAAGSHDDVHGQLLLLRGFAREQLGSLLFARDDLDAAARILAATGNRHRVVNCDHNLAVVQLQLGRFDRALELAEATCRAYHEQSPSWYPHRPDQRDDNGIFAMRKVRAQALMARAAVGDEDEALREFEALAAGYFSESNFDVLASIAELRLRRLPSGSDDPAIVAALARLRGLCGGAPEQPLVCRAELLHADYERRRGDLAGARRRLRAIAPCIDESRHRLLAVERASLLGQVELAAGDGAAALTAFATAATLFSEIVREQQMWRRTGATGLFAARFRETLHGAFAAWQLAMTTGDPAAVPRLYEILQAFHGFESRCFGAAASVGFEGDAEATRGMQALRLEEQEHARLLVNRAGHPLAERRRKKLLADAMLRIEHEEAKLQALARLRAPELLAPSARSLGEVQAALQQGELLVECADAGASAFAFLIRCDAVDVVALPADAAWHGMLEAMRDNVDAGRDDEARAVSADLAARLWPLDGAFARCLAGPGLRRVLWSPEGRFAAVPLALLPWSGAPLVATVGIVHGVSGDRLARQRTMAMPARSRQALRLLAVGRPSAASSAMSRLRQRRLTDDEGFPELPASAKEVRDVADLFANPAERAELSTYGDDDWIQRGVHRGERFHVLLDAAANENDVVAAADACDVLHFACHASAEPGEPWLSFLVFALGVAGPGSSAGDDGLLRLSEWWRLRGPRELVVLSACRTGAATADTHDVVGGLAWAAQMAGARRVLASLWNVEDTAAHRFAVAFHRQFLRQGLGAGDSLAAVQRQALQEHWLLRDWAGFVVWGDPE